MLKSINETLKIMGEALAFANTGEMLSEKQKNRVLAAQPKQPSITATSTSAQTRVSHNKDFSIEPASSTTTL